MPSTLSEEQLLLINNLLYLENNPPFEELQEGQTIGEILNKVDLDQLDPGKDYSAFTSGKEWRDVINACKSDPQITSLQIAKSHTDPKYGGTNFLMTSPDNGEAIVAFRGTAQKEWKDNFAGGGTTNLPDGVSTECQQRALEWYQSLDLDSYDTVTVTGHSKGGNKSQYIAILDNSVDRCYSFDGQGFSDEFYSKYADQIARNQHKITNCSEESDYVNFLLNSVGTQKYYKGHSYGSDTPFAENHCPNTMLSFDKNGKPIMIETEQSEDIKRLDHFLNSYLRSTPDKSGALNLVGTLMQKAQNGESTEDIMKYLTDGTHQAQVAFLVAYLFYYREQHPDIEDAIKRILNGLGINNSDSIIDIIVALHDNGLFNVIGEVAQFPVAQSFLIDKLQNDANITLTDKEYQNLCNMLVLADRYRIHTKGISGEDKSVESKPVGIGSFHIDTSSAKQAVSGLNALASEVKTLSAQIQDMTNMLKDQLILLKPALELNARTIIRASDALSAYSDSLSEIAELYISTETKNIEMIPFIKLE